MLQELLDKYNLKYEELNQTERDTLRTWLESLQKNQVTTDDIKAHITAMKESLEAELAGFDSPATVWEYVFRSKKDLYRRARLRNYILLLNFLTGPEKAKKALEASLKNIKPKS